MRAAFCVIAGWPVLLVAFGAGAPVALVVLALAVATGVGLRAVRRVVEHGDGRAHPARGALARELVRLDGLAGRCCRSATWWPAASPTPRARAAWSSSAGSSPRSCSRWGSCRARRARLRRLETAPPVAPPGPRRPARCRERAGPAGSRRLGARRGRPAGSRGVLVPALAEQADQEAHLDLLDRPVQFVGARQTVLLPERGVRQRLTGGGGGMEPHGAGRGVGPAGHRHGDAPPCASGGPFGPGRAAARARMVAVRP